jgi:hypothetical protein
MNPRPWTISKLKGWNLWLSTVELREVKQKSYVIVSWVQEASPVFI